MGAPEQIERRVMDMIDWLVDQDFRQWQAITARLVERSWEYKDRVLGASTRAPSPVTGRARAVDPYRRFVRAEDSHWREAMARLSALRDEASAFRRDLAASFTAPA
jgi:hypothetical protein